MYSSLLNLLSPCNKYLIYLSKNAFVKNKVLALSLGFKILFP